MKGLSFLLSFVCLVACRRSTQAIPPTATIPATPSPQTISQVDSFYYDTSDSSVRSSAILQLHQNYRVTLSGTFSYWSVSHWAVMGVCWGATEPQPLFPSPDQINGPVGADPYQSFGHPNGGDCSNGQLTYPGAPTSPIMFSVDEVFFSLLTPTEKTYREDHTYTYLIVGQGHPLIIGLADNPLYDNYGQIFIVIEQIPL